MSKGFDSSLLHSQEHLLKRSSLPIATSGLLFLSANVSMQVDTSPLLSPIIQSSRSNTELENVKLVETWITRAHRLTHLVYTVLQVRQWLKGGFWRSSRELAEGHERS